MNVRPGQRIALVLGAGGARGLAHVGVIEVLLERGFVIAAVAGCSMGSLVGGVYAAGRLREYRQWALSLQRSDVLRLLDVSFGLPGLIRGERLIGVLKELIGDHRIEDLAIGYTAVATDLDTQREVWLNRGPLWDAIRASIAIPMLFTPHHIDGRELVDGGLLDPVPIAATRLAHVDHVVAVDVNGPVSWRPEALAATAAEVLAEAYHDGPEVYAPDEPAEASLGDRVSTWWNGWRERAARPSVAGAGAQRGALDLLSRSLDTMHAHMTRLHLAQDPPDLLIQLPSSSCAIYEFWRAAELIERGRAAAEKALEKIADQAESHRAGGTLNP